MLGSDNLDLIGRSCLKLMQFMQLGKCEKGSISMEGKFKSLQMRWFAIKTAKRSNDSTWGAATATVDRLSKETLW